MKIAVDKNSYKVAKNDGNEYIYLYEDESLEDLMKTRLHCMEYNECEYVDINTTDYNIDCIKKCKITDKDWNKLPEKKDYKIGIIIPNYNYEHTIEKCLNSIFNQTYTNYEIIFVDDGSYEENIKDILDKIVELDDNKKYVMLEEQTLDNVKYYLVYRKTRDLDESFYFHYKCDNQGTNIVLCKHEKGYI